MYKTFNCGIGFIFGIKEKDVRRCLDFIKEKTVFKVDIIGKVVPARTGPVCVFRTGRNVIIESQFSNLTIVL